MGINIAGIAINKSYQDQIEELGKDLNFILLTQEKVSFEVASANWTDKGLAYIYFTDFSTLVFLEMSLASLPFSIPYRNVLTFSLSETVMAFSLNYSEGNTCKRSLIEWNGVIKEDKGIPFEFEREYGDVSGIIWRKLDDVLGIPFVAIGLDREAIKCKVSWGNPEASKQSLHYKEANKPIPTSPQHQKELLAEFTQFSNSKVFEEFHVKEHALKNLEDKPTNLDQKAILLVETAILKHIAKERGIDLSKPE